MRDYLTEKGNISSDKANSFQGAGPSKIKDPTLTTPIKNSDRDGHEGASTGPLVASLNADGENEEVSLSKKDRTSEALLATTADTYAPKAPLPSLNESGRSDSNLSKSSSSSEGFSSDSKNNSETPRSSDSSVKSGDDAPVVNAPKLWNGRLMGPMEPMQPISRDNSTISNQIPRYYGLPKILDVPRGGSAVQNMPPQAPNPHDFNGIPSLTEDSRLAKAMADEPGSHSKPVNTTFPGSAQKSASGSVLGPNTSAPALGSSLRLATGPYSGSANGDGATSVSNYPAPLGYPAASIYAYPQEPTCSTAVQYEAGAPNLPPVVPQVSQFPSSIPQPVAVTSDGHNGVVGTSDTSGHTLYTNPPLYQPSSGNTPGHLIQNLTQSHETNFNGVGSGHPVIAYQMMLPPEMQSTNSAAVEQKAGYLTPSLGNKQQEPHVEYNGIPTWEGPSLPMALQTVQQAKISSGRSPIQNPYSNNLSSGGNGMAPSMIPRKNETKVHKCTYPGCSWSFVRSSDHKRYLRSHGKPSLRCPFAQVELGCSKKSSSFYRLDVLKRHLRLVHMIRPADGDRDGGECRVCGENFLSSREFIDHCEQCARQKASVSG